MSTVRIGLITTLNTNIGDDFIREGICLVLKDVFKSEKIEFINVNKHVPFTAYPPLHPIHLRKLAGFLPIFRDEARNAVETFFSKLGYCTFDGCNLIVQCGAPVFWPNCSHSEWARPLWHEIVGRLCDKIPVLNLAAGSCYPWERQSDSPKSKDDADYIKSILGYCRLTTVRDRLAKNICTSAGTETPLIPCSAFLAARGHKTEYKANGYILINYMSGGGHFAWDQGIDDDEWERTIKNTVQALGKRHKLAFLCHDEKEFLLVNKINSELPVFYPKTSAEYFECVSSAKFGICNRMHASVAMAGLGIPSIAVCTDTRLMMVAELGLPVHYVKDISALALEEEAEVALKSLEGEKERLLLLQSTTYDMYHSIILNTLSHA